MKIGINEYYQIKQIREITDTTLIIIDVDEDSFSYPFYGWSDNRILSYCYKKTKGGLSIYPYIDTNIIEKIEQQEGERLKLQAIIDTMLTGGAI